jgi:RNA polymerase sigma factor (sigma-70 family)
MTNHHEGALQPSELSDTELIVRTRAGDQLAFETLFRRHAEAVRRYARTCCRDEHAAEDLAAEVFARTLHAVRGGAGPKTAMRAYLLTAVRQVAVTWAMSARRTQLVEDFALFAVQAVNPAAQGKLVAPGAEVQAMQAAEQSLAMRAFRSLPERWQTVLWHTTVDGESPRDVAPLLGLTPNATAALAVRAREALKQAYLQAHVSAALTRSGDCARHADRLGAYARGGLGARADRNLRNHLDTCPACHTAALELAELSNTLRAVLPAAIFGWIPSDGIFPAWPTPPDADAPDGIRRAHPHQSPLTRRTQIRDPRHIRPNW